MKKNVLIIDDDAGILEATSIILEMEGYEVSTSLDGEIINSLPKNLPDVILIDYLLSGTDGCELTKKLKLKNATKSIPIVMMSAHPSARILAEKAGINEFIPKPFDMNILLEVVKRCIN